jgi:hypothetical protein
MSGVLPDQFRLSRLKEGERAAAGAASLAISRYGISNDGCRSVGDGLGTAACGCRRLELSTRARI